MRCMKRSSAHSPPSKSAALRDDACSVLNYFWGIKHTARRLRVVSAHSSVRTLIVFAMAMSYGNSRVTNLVGLLPVFVMVWE